MPRRWPTVKLWWPRWRPSGGRRGRRRRPRGRPRLPWRRRKPLLALAGEEAEVLGLGLLRDREAVAGGDGADLVLGHLGEREAEPAEQLRRQRREHVALVLGRVGAVGEQRPLGVLDDPGVVAGDQPRRPEPLGEVEHRRQPHFAVAEDAGVRRLPFGVAADEAIDDAAAEVGLEVEREVRDVERVRDGARAEHRLRRAAGLGPVGLRVGPELDRDRDDLGPALAFEQRRDGRVDAAGDGDGDALGDRTRPPSLAIEVGVSGPTSAAVAGSSGRLEAAAALRARWRASVASWAAWRLDGSRPPRSASASSIERLAASRTVAPSMVSARAAVAARVAPQPSVSKVTEAMRPPSTLRESRERSPQAAPPAAPVKASSGAGPRRVSSREEVVEELPIHWSKGTA